MTKQEQDRQEKKKELAEETFVNETDRKHHNDRLQQIRDKKLQQLRYEHFTILYKNKY